MDCDVMECSTPEESFTLTLLPCNRSIKVTILDNGNGMILLDDTIHSMPQLQELYYGTMEYLNVSLQLATEEYYILSLESSFGLMFAPTAIPTGIQSLKGPLVTYGYSSNYLTLQVSAGLLTPISIPPC